MLARRVIRRGRGASPPFYPYPYPYSYSSFTQTLRQTLVVFLCLATLALTTASTTAPLSQRIKSALSLRFQPHPPPPRVMECWDAFTSGKKLHRYLDNDNDKQVLQTADCFVSGLTAQCFHDPYSAPFASWINGLEASSRDILSELVTYEKSRHADKVHTGLDVLQKNGPTGVGEQGDGLWLGPRDTSGSHYGPEWKTLGLQDRSVWDADLTKQFPVTMNKLKELHVPSCEVFFAKQGPRSGLKPHSDKNNFIITCHLGLDVPEGECWIRVGNEEHYWKNGKTCIFDTSVIHSTENTSDRIRYVLLIRFWHPELTSDEIEAFKFIFDYLDHASLGDEALEQFEFTHLFMGKDNNHAGLQKENVKSTAQLLLEKKSSSSSSSSSSSKSSSKESKKSSPSSTAKGFGAPKK